MTVTCKNCGQEWERDPTLEVACPSCTAEVDQKCRRPSGHSCRIHADRDRRALEKVDGYSQCPATSADAPEQPVESPSGEADHNENSPVEIRQATLST